MERWNGDEDGEEIQEQKAKMKASCIIVIGVAIEKIHNDLQHRFKKAYFFAWYATKVANPLALQRLLSLLLVLKSILPSGKGLMPVICRCLGERIVKRCLER